MLTEQVTEAMSLIHSLMDGTTGEWLKARVPSLAKVESSAQLTYQQILEIIQAVCSVVVPACAFIQEMQNKQKTAQVPCVPCGDKSDDADTAKAA